MDAIHDVSELKRRISGDEKFIDKLDKPFEPDIFDVGNEPDFTRPYLYDFVNVQQWRSAERGRATSALYNSDKMVWLVT